VIFGILIGFVLSIITVIIQTTWAHLKSDPDASAKIEQLGLDLNIWKTLRSKQM